MILTKAIAGLARSGATRSGWPVLVGARVPLYALSGVARSGATRSNYIDTSHAFISVGGIEVGAIHPGGPRVGVLVDSLTIDDSLSSTPTTGALTAYGWVPVEGADVVIRLGSKNNLDRNFGGTILKTRHRYAGDYPIARNMLYDCALIDYSWGLQRKKVSGRFKATTVGAIATSLMTVAPVGYVLHVDGDIAAAAIDEITFTETNLDDAIGQLVKRVGGDWQCDYTKGVHLFLSDKGISSPAIINTAHRTMAGITWTRDLSQVVTRVYVDAGGSDALEAIAPGDTLIPVATAAWYPTTGGVVLAGPQRVQYATVVAGGGGSLVGPGASPTGAPNVTLQPGAGVDVGTHDYAVTFTTPSGETIPGPRVTVPVGLFLAPPTAPTAGTPGGGATGPDPGVHDYAVAFTISTGETVPGPRVVGTTGLTDPPLTGPTPDAVNAGNGPDDGVHDYAVGFGTATGSTPPGPIGAQITTSTLAPPSGAPSFGPGLPAPTAGVLPAGSYDYATMYVTAAGETTVGPIATINIPGIVRQVQCPPPSSAPTLTQGAGTVPWAVGDHVQIGVTFVSATGETTVGPLGSVTITSSPCAVNASNIPLGPTGTIARYLYRIQVFGSTPTGNVYYYVINDNTTTAAANLQTGTQSSSSGQVGPPSNTATVPQTTTATIPILGLPITGDARITGKRLYRRVTGPAAFQLVRQLAPSVGQFGITAPSLGTMIIYVSGSGAGPLSVGAYSYKVTFQTAEGETEGSAATNVVNITNPASAGRIDVYNIPVPSADLGVTGKRVYRTVANGTAWQLVASLAPGVVDYNDAIPDSSLGGGAPTVNATGDRVNPAGAAAPNTTTAYLRAVHVSDIPRGTAASGTTARNLYRRSGGAGLRYLATIYDNSSSVYTDTTPNAGLGAAPSAVNSATLRQIPLSKIPIGNSLVLSRKVYRTIANAGGGTLKLVATIGDNTTTDFLDTVNDAALGAAALTVGTAQAAQAQLTAIPLGAASVTARKVYRTKAGLAQLQLLTTIADNVTVAWLDIAPDAALGVNAPASDTSTLKQPEGNILAGSPSLPCASVAAFRAAGGWAIVASQIVRYTGITGNASIGIPATGPGAITATITFNTTAVAAPLLTGIPATGVGAIRVAIVKGDAVDLFIQEDDVAAQTALAAQLGGGADGIVEDEIQNRRLSATEARARARARLALLAERDADGKVGIVTVAYTCRDIGTRAGASVTINLGPPVNLFGDFLIQRVTVNQFGNPHVPPTYSVEASSVRFTFEELLRVIREAAA